MSRESVQNDADSAALVRVYEDNVVGSGIRPQCTVDPDELGISTKQAAEWRKACEREWERWSNQEADATGVGSFYDLQRLAARTRKVDGEVLGHAIIDGDSISVELIDCDRLDSPNMLDTQTMRGGVEINSAGRPVAYHIRRVHPDDVLGSSNQTFDRVLATVGGLSIVQHHYRRERPAQTRGVPDIASAQLYKKHLHHYLNSELIAARAASNYALFIKKQVDASDPDIFPVQSEEAGAVENYHEVLEPGTIAYLNEGEEPVPFSPNRPGTAFDPFVVRILRAWAASQGLAYELVAKDFGSMNYSSARAMLLECRRTFDADRTLLVRQFCAPWWRNVMLTAVRTGRLQAPPRFLDDPDAWLRVRWVAPAYGWVDPTKEIEASTMAVQANLSTPYDEAARSGMQADAILEARARFLARAAELETQYGLPAGSLAPTSAPTNGPSGGGQANDGEGAEDSNMTDATQATKERLDGLGLAVRSGLISPSAEVEETLRAEFGLPPMSADVEESWANNPVRRPVTIAGPSDDAPVPVVDQKQDQQPPAPPPAAGGQEGDEAADDSDEEESDEAA
jgi:lambda family phage portal protein